ncbi:MAG TPA: hypothetical protein VJH92_03625 [Candidatus Nanoarchaeia archaeon]|nr:hypothetical protein [Candidatus Nanoarchaeia archaeon]
MRELFIHGGEDNEDMDSTRQARVLPGLSERLKVVLQTSPQILPQNNSVIKYNTGVNIRLTSTTGATVEGRLGGVDGERGAFYVGARVYHPNRFKEKVTIKRDSDNSHQYYLEVSI